MIEIIEDHDDDKEDNQVIQSSSETSNSPLLNRYVGHPVVSPPPCPNCHLPTSCSFPAFHPPHPFLSRYWTCDRCLRDFGAARVRWLCLPCDVDLCWDCHPPLDQEEADFVVSYASLPAALKPLPTRLALPLGIARREWIYYRRVMKAQGFREGSLRKLQFDIGFVRLRSRRLVQFVQRLQPYQRVNWFPFQTALSNKAKLNLSMKALRQRIEPRFCSFWPVGYSLPEELEAFLSHTDPPGCSPASAWILKPPRSARGENIRFIPTPQAIAQQPALRRWMAKFKPLAQRYVDNPLLLQGYKCSLRVYYCITSLNPLCVYVFDEGLVRICSAPYVPLLPTAAADPSATKGHQQRWDRHPVDQFSHLDSIDINEKRTGEFAQQFPSLPGMEGLRMLISGWVAHLQAQYPQIPEVTRRIWDGIFTAVFVSTLAGQAEMSRGQNLLETHRGNLSWVHYGCDILFDDQFNPWLLEINAYPSLSPHTQLEEPVKVGLIESLFHLNDFSAKDHELANVLLRRRFPQLRMLQRMLANHAIVSTIDEDQRKRLEKFLPHHLLLNKLTKYDLRLIIQLELQIPRAPHFTFLLSHPIMATFIDILPNDRTLLFYLWFSSQLSTLDFESIQ